MTISFYGIPQWPRLVWNKGRFEWRPCMDLIVGLCEKTIVNGQPRERVVRHLAYFNESRYVRSNMAEKIKTRVMFWKRLRRKLDALGSDLTPEYREKGEAQIAARVPRPTTEDIESYRVIVAAKCRAR